MVLCHDSWTCIVWLFCQVLLSHTHGLRFYVTTQLSMLDIWAVWPRAWFVLDVNFFRLSLLFVQYMYIDILFWLNHVLTQKVACLGTEYNSEHSLTVRALTSLYITLSHTTHSKSFTLLTWFVRHYRSLTFLATCTAAFKYCNKMSVCTVFQLCEKHLRRDFVYISIKASLRVGELFSCDRKRWASSGSEFLYELSKIARVRASSGSPGSVRPIVSLFFPSVLLCLYVCAKAGIRAWLVAQRQATDQSLAHWQKELDRSDLRDQNLTG